MHDSKAVSLAILMSDAFSLVRQGMCIPSMPWQEAPAFYQSLDDKSLPQLALRLLMLTGLRSHPVRYAHLDEIEGDIWTIPGEKMKGRKGKTADFRVPLTPEALHVIKLASQQQRDG